MPYRIDLPDADHATLDLLVDLGALDVELSQNGALSALLPDSITPEQVSYVVGVESVAVLPAKGRDEGSVWVLSPRAIRTGRIRIVPAHVGPEPGALKLIDASAFGTGLHPTTAMCLEVLDEEVQIAVPNDVLDVGTGSGVLALAALMLGVPAALGIDVDDDALGVAAENARLNGLGERLKLARGGPESLTGTWPLVFANLVAAPLIEMAAHLVRHVGHHGVLVLSGIPASVEPDVERTYRNLGMALLRVKSRAGWVALVLRASW